MAEHRALIIGAGGAGTAVAKGFEEDGRAKAAAFIEARPERREELATDFPDAEVAAADDYLALLEKVKPDIVVDAGPDYLHAEHTVTALEHGCHVLIEKPMCTTADEAAAIRDAEAKAPGKVVMVDYTLRYSHPWATMMEAARAGEVGNIFYMGAYYIHDMYDWFAPDGKNRTPWRIHKDHPQNVLLGGGCHGLDLMLCALEDVPVTEVYCCGNNMSGSELPIEDCYVVAMKFANGVIGKVFVSTGVNSGGFGKILEIFGDGGTLMDGQLLRRGCDPVDLEQPTDNVQEGHGWNLTTRDFLDIIDGKRENEMTTLFGARNVSILHSALVSCAEGGAKPVRWFE